MNWRNAALVGALGFVFLNTPTLAQTPQALEGEWASSYGPYKGGLRLTNITDDGGKLKGTILFQSSGCPVEKPFEGRYEDGGNTLIVNTHLGSPCGKVGLKMAKDGNGWKGKYIAEYPDGGDVRLSKK